MTMRTLRLPLLSLGAAVLAASCAAGPDYAPPPAATPDAPAFVEADAALYAGEAPPADWWTLYGDPVLDRLVGEAFAANTDLRVAEANLRRSRALLSEARGARLPSTTVRGQATAADSGPDAAARAVDNEPNAYEAWTEISYEADLFGRLGRAVEAGRADVEAQQAARDLVRITVAADVAQAYADVCAIGAQIEAAGRSATAQDETAGIASRRLELGDATPLEAAQARAELQRTLAVIPTLQAERRSALYRLAVLIGRLPEDVPDLVEGCVTPPRLASLLPVGDAPGLLERRPDIRRAERELAAATARIGVATADLYPRLTFGLAGGVTADVGFAPAPGDDPVWRIQATPLLSWTFPNITAARARIAASEADADGALAAWEGTVLTALQETESALAVYAGEIERAEALQAMLEQSTEAAAQARLRRDAGADAPLTLLDAERRLAEAETLLAASQRQLVQNQITLFLALGGGWSAPAEE